MTVARSQQIDLDTTPYYHIMSRCVRRSYLCGIDKETGKDFSYRKVWLVNRLKHQAKAFAMDIAAYAIMDNHYHLVLHVDQDRARGWSEKEVIERWSWIYPRDAKTIQDLSQANPSHPKVRSAVIKWRDRLMNIPWFMRTLNEYMARRCNYDDGCKGRFWEGRYKSQALLDEGALLSAMAYVDLNPVRAKVSETPEDSEFTSIQERIRAFQKQKRAPSTSSSPKPQPKGLMRFKDKKCHLQPEESYLDFTLEDYLKLVDETGRVVRQDKRGAIKASLAPILQRVHMCPRAWVKMVNNLEDCYAYAIGDREHLTQFNRGSKALKGAQFSYMVYKQAS